MNNAVKDETISLIGLFNIVSLLVTFHLAYRVHLSVQLFAEKKIHALTSKFPLLAEQIVQFYLALDKCSSECGTEPVCISGSSFCIVSTDQYFA